MYLCLLLHKSMSTAIIFHLKYPDTYLATTIIVKTSLFALTQVQYTYNCGEYVDLHFEIKFCSFRRYLTHSSNIF